MRKCLIFSLIFFAKFALSQVNDNFDDGNFVSSPPWTGSNSSNDFTVVNNQLRSNSTTANSSFYLSTPSSLAGNCVWEFYCNLQFATSGSNYVDIYLTSDQQNLQSNSINGYFVRIGNTNDEICLYKRSGASNTSVKLIDGADGIVSSTTNNRIKIKVTRSSSNIFTLERDVTGAGSAYVSEGSITDATFTTSGYFGILVQQSTSSFFQKHFFDDISVRPIVVDNTLPKVVSASALTENTIELVFDEAVDEAAAKNPANYILNNSYGSPSSVLEGTLANSFILSFSKSFITASYTLTVANVPDKAGNVIGANNSATFNYIATYIAKKGDVVINEIFADPSPQVDLPGVEFVELWNTTSTPIPLQNWKFSDPSSTASLPSLVIQANEYLILCAKADTNEFKQYGKVLGISPWPSLNNSGDFIKLVSDKGLLIDSIDYKDSWYKNTEKKSGGWTLEMIDNKAVCKGIQNWAASTDVSGGTPGRRNSVSQLSSGSTLTLEEAVLVDSVTVRVKFNRAIDSLSASNPASFVLNNGVGSPAFATPLAPDFNSVELKFAKAIGRGKMYHVVVNNITDCAGTIIFASNNAVDFTSPDRINKGDILISEILFNPRPEGADFVEIFNNSDKEFDLRELSIATIKGDTLATVKSLTSAQTWLKPHSYLVLTVDPENIKKEYSAQSPDTFLKMTSMPAFNDDEGTVVLLSANTRIDQFTYSEKMHFGLIKDAEGVSLERVSFNRSANEAGNFRSAASTVGFATPGYKNSQSMEVGYGNEEVSLMSRTFSPDNDGFEDVLTVLYHFPQPGLVANASVFSDKGVLVRKLYRNATLATEGALTWDGFDERASRAPVGIYVVYLEVFDLNGKVKKYRKSCVLAEKL